MTYYNQNSKRINPFQAVYDSTAVKTIPKQSPPFPKFIDIELTNYCNQRCLMCPRAKAERKRGFMLIQLFKNIVRECNKYHTPIRLIGWGEPTLHPYFIEYIEFIKRYKNQLLHITTNGILLRNEISQSIFDNKVDSLIVSLQGTNPKQYKLMRNTHSYFKVQKNVEEFIKLRKNQKQPFVQVTTTTTLETSKEKQQFIDEWLPLVDAVSVGRTNLNILPEVPSPLLKIKNYAKPLGRVPCTEVYHLVQVDWDGMVSPCCGDWDNFLTIGNANKDSIYNIWNKSKKLKYIRELLKDKHHKTLNLCSRCFPSYLGVD